MQRDKGVVRTNVEGWHSTTDMHERPEYKRLVNNRWDGTDMNQLTIDHLKEVSWCYYNRISLEECSDISNLEVVPMKENIRRHRQKKQLI